MFLGVGLIGAATSEVGVLDWTSLQNVESRRPLINCGARVWSWIVLFPWSVFYSVKCFLVSGVCRHIRIQFDPCALRTLEDLGGGEHGLGILGEQDGTCKQVVSCTEISKNNSTEAGTAASTIDTLNGIKINYFGN